MLVATVSGYVGNADLRTTNDGKPVLNFSVAHSEKPKGGEEKTTWVRVSVFGNRAEALSNWIVKGAHVTAVGALRVGLYESRDGKTTLNVDMSAMEVSFTAGRGRSDDAPPAHGGSAPSGSVNDDDVPF